MTNTLDTLSDQGKSFFSRFKIGGRKKDAPDPPPSDALREECRKALSALDDLANPLMGVGWPISPKRIAFRSNSVRQAFAPIQEGARQMDQEHATGRSWKKTNEGLTKPLSAARKSLAEALEELEDFKARADQWAGRHGEIVAVRNKAGKLAARGVQGADTICSELGRFNLELTSVVKGRWPSHGELVAFEKTVDKMTEENPPPPVTPSESDDDPATLRTKAIQDKQSAILGLRRDGANAIDQMTDAIGVHVGLERAALDPGFGKRIADNLDAYRQALIDLAKSPPEDDHDAFLAILKNTADGFEQRHREILGEVEAIIKDPAKAKLVAESDELQDHAEDLKSATPFAEKLSELRELAAVLDDWGVPEARKLAGAVESVANRVPDAIGYAEGLEHLIRWGGRLNFAQTRYEESVTRLFAPLVTKAEELRRRHTALGKAKEGANNEQLLGIAEQKLALAERLCAAGAADTEPSIRDLLDDCEQTLVELENAPDLVKLRNLRKVRIETALKNPLLATHFPAHGIEVKERFALVWDSTLSERPQVQLDRLDALADEVEADLADRYTKMLNRWNAMRSEIETAEAGLELLEQELRETTGNPKAGYKDLAADIERVKALHGSRNGHVLDEARKLLDAVKDRIGTRASDPATGVVLYTVETKLEEQRDKDREELRKEFEDLLRSFSDQHGHIYHQSRLLRGLKRVVGSIKMKATGSDSREATEIRTIVGEAVDEGTLGTLDSIANLLGIGEKRKVDPAEYRSAIAMLKFAIARADRFAKNPQGQKSTKKSNLGDIPKRWDGAVATMGGLLDTLRDRADKHLESMDDQDKAKEIATALAKELDGIRSRFQAGAFDAVVGRITDGKASADARKKAREDGLRIVRLHRDRLNDPVCQAVVANPFGVAAVLTDLNTALFDLELNMMRQNL